MAVKASKLGAGTLKITPEDGQEKQFEGYVTQIQWEPDYKTEEPIPVLSGDTYQPPGELTSKISGSMLQDYLSSSLIKWCYDNRGKEAAFEFVPAIADNLGLKGRLMITPVGIGGDINKTNTIGFEFPMIGDPEMTDTGSHASQ